MTVSDVLEEMRHAYQDRVNMFGTIGANDAVYLRREIEAQEYLISVADKYRIPIDETRATKKSLEDYKRRLNEMIEVTGYEHL